MKPDGSDERDRELWKPLCHGHPLDGSTLEQGVIAMIMTASQYREIGGKIKKCEIIKIRQWDIMMFQFIFIFCLVLARWHFALGAY